MQKEAAQKVMCKHRRHVKAPQNNEAGVEQGQALVTEREARSDPFFDLCTFGLYAYDSISHVTSQPAIANQ